MPSRDTQIILEADVSRGKHRDEKGDVGRNGLTILLRVRAGWEDVPENIRLLDRLSRDIVEINDFLGYLFKDTGLFIQNEFHT